MRSGVWPGKVLQRTGQLAASIESHADATSATARKGKALAFGGICRRFVHNPGSNILARPFLALGVGEERQTQESVLLLLTGILG